MNANRMSSLLSREESLDSAYAREVMRQAAIWAQRAAPRDRQRLQPVLRQRCAHLEESRSMVAPSPLRDVALFI